MCIRDRCEVEWDYGVCSVDSDCVRVEHGPFSDPLVNACAAHAAERFARAISASSGRTDGEVRITSRGAACVAGLCVAVGE